MAAPTSPSARSYTVSAVGLMRTHSLSSLKTPSVFVIPPEEEQTINPPWCCFDPAVSDSNGFLLDTLPDLEPCAGAPGTSTHTDASQPLVSSGEDGQIPDVPISSAVGYPSGVDTEQADEDIVEVVKVGRKGPAANKEAPVESKGLKARATHVLRSLKSVRRGNVRKHSEQGHTAPLSDRTNDAPEVPPPRAAKAVDDASHLRSDTSILSRRLSQLFQLSSSSRAPLRPSTEAPEVSPTLSPSDFSDASFGRDSTHETTSTRSATNKRSTRQLSLFDIHRFFDSSPDLPSASDPHTAPPSASAGRNSPHPSLSSPSLATAASASFHARTLRSSSRASSRPGSPSTESSFEEVTTPVDDRRMTARSSDVQKSRGGRGQDTSIEMRLDSLQFDSLHFDPEEFQTSF